MDILVDLKKTQSQLPSVPGSAKEAREGKNATTHIYQSADPKQSIDVFKGGGLKISAHIHPSGTSGGDSNTGDVGPGDPAAHTAAVGSGHKTSSSYSMAVGAGDNKVSFYNGDKTLGTLQFTTLLKIYGIK